MDKERIAELRREIESLNPNTSWHRVVGLELLDALEAALARAEGAEKDSERIKWLANGGGAWSLRWSRWNIAVWGIQGLPNWTDIRGEEFLKAVDLCMERDRLGDRGPIHETPTEPRP